jgi:hypothetical protein
MYEHDLIFESDGLKLSGTLCLPGPTGQSPGVLLIPGSGQMDRNENSPRLQLNAFHDLSGFLARSGIASLRYDKRGVGKSEGDYWATGFKDRIQDAFEALGELKQQDTIQPHQVFIIGHSEGAVIAARMASEGANVAGAILLAGSARSGEAVLKWQASQIGKGLKGVNGWLVRTLHIDVAKAQQKELDRIKGSKKDFYRRQFLVKVNAKWLREFMAYDPAVDLPRVTVPMLAITGSKDIQVDPADLERMAGLVRTPFECHEIQGMTHLLRLTNGDGQISDYRSEIKRPIAPELLEIVLHWLQERISESTAEQRPVRSKV